MVRFFRSLRFRLIILAVGALLPALGVIIHNGLEMRRQATAATQDNLRRLVTLVAREQAQKTMAARQLLMGLSQAPAICRHEAAACSAFFGRLISEPSLFINLGAIDRDGNIFASGVPTPGPLNTSHLPYFQKAVKTRDFAVGNLQFGRIVQKPVLIFSYPLLDAAGEVQTVLYASVGLDWLDNLAAQAGLPKGSVLAIIDEQGTIMAKYPDPGKWAGKSLPPGGLFDLIRQHREGVAEVKGMDGLLRLYAFTSLARDPHLGFVYAGIPTRVIYAAADQALRRNLAVLGGVLLLALGLAWGFGYLFIMRRLNPLLQATARLATGDLAVRSGLTKGLDELGQLARAFDQMAASLHEREAERQQAEEALRESEKLYRSLFDNMLNGFAYFKMLVEDNQPHDLIFLSVNRAFEPLTGLKDVVGKKVSQVIPGMSEADPELFEFFGRVALTGKPERVEIYVASLHDWYTISAYSPAKEYFVTIFDVITDRKRAEEALQASEALLRESQRIAHIGSWSMKLTENIIRWSDEMYPIYGVTKEGFLPTVESFLDLIHPEDRSLMTRWIEQAIGNLKPKELDFRIILPDGTVRYILGSGGLITDQAGKPERIAGTAQDITDRKRLEAERERLALAIEQAAEMVVITDATGIIQYVNPAFESVTGYERLAAIGRTSRLFKDKTQDEEPYHTMRETIAAGKTWAGRFADRKKDGTPYTAEVRISPVRDGTGGIVNYVAVMHDITEHLRIRSERTSIEAQLHQAQKMDAVGRLAGGVAHDFNNMLGVIIGHAEMALMRVSATDPLQHSLQEINEAAQRSADLTRQLLAFARRQTVSPQVLDLNDVVSGMLKMLRRLIGEDIYLAWMPGHELWKVKIDPSQIDQILANLVVNARDAIAGVGKLTIETSNVVLDAAYCTDHAEFVPGEYVLLAVSDDGSGIDKEILGKIFEPFFTTKREGEGTGLGLATVFGIVKQNDGFINVYSESGHGTTFKIYLPRRQPEAAQDQAEAAAKQLQGGSETVLMVEDEKAIRGIGQAILERLGYTVLTAGTPKDAIRLVGEHTGDIQLLISDIVMPEMNGRELADRLMAIKPGLKCLYISGYTANVIAHRGFLDEGVHFLPKPFSMRALATKVREVLED